MWDVKTGNKVREIPVKEVSILKFNKQGNILATAGGLFDKNIKLWSYPSFKLLKKIESKNGMPSTIDFSKDNKIIISSGDEKLVKFWDIKTGKNFFEELE
jgi:WD40 repeat protein